ncbi:MAG: flagellar biosynthetic protein FliO [Rhodanobacteraceae bacterium]
MDQGTALPLLQTLVALAAVIGVVLVLAWLARRMQRSGLRGSATLRSRASLMVGAHERVLLVEAAGQFLLLGVTPSQVRLLHRYEAPPDLPHPPAIGSPTEGFAAWLRAARNARG